MGNSRNLANLLGTGSTIATAKIADDAITSALLAADAVDANALSSSAITSGDLPAGCVLQIVTSSNFISSEVQISAGNSYNFATVSITPKSSSSTLIFFSNPRFYTRAADRTSSNNNSNTHIIIEDITNSTDVKHDEWINYSDAQYTTNNTDGFRVRYPVLASFSNSVTTQRQFRTRADAKAGYGSGRIGGEGIMFQMIVEVE